MIFNNFDANFQQLKYSCCVLGLLGTVPHSEGLDEIFEFVSAS